jgi:hypothetical protein
VIYSRNGARRLRLAAALTAAAFALGVGLTARGEVSPEDRALAESLFLQARQLIAEGRHAEACPKLAESQRLDPAGGTLLNLAACWEAERKFISAWVAFHEALGVARRDGRSDREKFALTRIEGLRSRLSFLTVRLAPSRDVAGLELRRDRAVMRPAQLGAVIPLNPGPVTLEATAPGREPWRRVVDLKPGEHAVVVVPPLAPLRLARVAPPASGATTSLAVAATPTSPHRARLVSGVVVGAASLASLAVGTYFGVSAISKANDVGAHCQGDVCDETGISLDRAARRAAVAADVTIAVGIVGAAVATYLLVTALRRRVHLAPRLAAGGGLVVGGIW